MIITKNSYNLKLNSYDLRLNSYDLRLNLACTLLIAELFIVFNPFYALFFSSVINFFCKKIDHKVFSFVFALSFALIFTNRDPGSAGDVVNYVSSYSENIGIFEALRFVEPLREGTRFVEPLWEIYRNFLFFVFRGDSNIFVLFNYFAQFLLIAILSRLISKENYIIVSCVIIFFNLALLHTIFQVWRHSFSMLLFFVGIYTIRARILIYLAPLIHIVTLPFMLIGSRLNYKIIVAFLTISYFMTSYIYERSSAYESIVIKNDVSLYLIFFAIVIFIIKYLQLVRLNYIENRIFYALIVFAFIPYFFEITSAFHVIYDRMIGFFYFFISIIVAKLIIRHSVISVAFILVYFIYRIGFTFNNPDRLLSLKYLGDGQPLYIFNGIFLLINDYDANRWSDYMFVFYNI